jgi:hypothetical protein
VHLSLPYLSGAAIMIVGFLVSLVWISPSGRQAGDLGLQSADG